MKVNELKAGMDNVEVTVKVVEVGRPRIVRTSRGNHIIAEAVVEDETGSIVVTLWDEKISSMSAGETVKIKNGYVSTVRGELRLNVGKYGEVEKLED